jgi:hypothetical protein
LGGEVRDSEVQAVDVLNEERWTDCAARPRQLRWPCSVVLKGETADVEYSRSWWSVRYLIADYVYVSTKPLKKIAETEVAPLGQRRRQLQSHGTLRNAPS